MGNMRIISRLGWVRRGSPGHGDTRRTKNKPSRPENLRPQEDLTQDLSAAGRSYSGSVGRRKILLRICRPQEDLTQDLSAAGRSCSGSVGRRKISLRPENSSSWNCSLSSKTRKEYHSKDPKGIPHHVLHC